MTTKVIKSAMTGSTIPVSRGGQVNGRSAGSQSHHPASVKANTRYLSVLFALALFPGPLLFGEEATTSPAAPQYTTDGHLKFPEQYREWIYLSTGFDMSYNPAMRRGHDLFDSVFVNRESYRAFVETGQWPDKTVLVLEVRGAEGKGSINKAGSYQSVSRMGVEVHVKDESRFQDKWAFFGFSGTEPSTMIPKTEDCYSCHAQHAAVDTTFVQFYPTLLPIARAKGTMSNSYIRESQR